LHAGRAASGMWAIRLTPVAKKARILLGAGHVWRNSGVKVVWVEHYPAFSKKRRASSPDRRRRLLARPGLSGEPAGPPG